MASFNLRIGAKLGIAAGVSVLLVGGMLANQVLGNQSVAESNRLLIINYLNKGNAQSVQTSMARAQIAALEISSAKSVEKIDELLQFSAPMSPKPPRRSTPRHNGPRARSHRMPTVTPGNSQMPI